MEGKRRTHDDNEAPETGIYDVRCGDLELQNWEVRFMGWEVNGKDGLGGNGTWPRS